jgi:hypothetical protein
MKRSEAPGDSPHRKDGSVREGFPCELHGQRGECIWAPARKYQGKIRVPLSAHAPVRQEYTVIDDVEAHQHRGAVPENRYPGDRRRKGKRGNLEHH